MTIDPRCCGSGTCIVDPTGRCWCGQLWDGEKMCEPLPERTDVADHPAGLATPAPQADA